MSVYDWPGSIDFSLDANGVARPDGPVGLRIDGRALMVAAGLDGVLDFRSLRVDDLADFAGNWQGASPRACPVQFVPDADFHPTRRPAGTLWFRQYKPAWEAKAFPRKYRLRFAPVSAGGKHAGHGRPDTVPARIESCAMSLDPAGRARWRRGEATSLVYEAPVDEPTGKPRFPTARTPAGHELLADMPRDHPWHRGLAIGWTGVECEQAGLRHYAYWAEPGGGYWWPSSLEQVHHGPVLSTLQSRIAYGTQEGRHVFDLALNVRYAAGDTRWDVLDLTMTIAAGEAPVTFRSDYGHLKARMALGLTNVALLAGDGDRRAEADQAGMRGPDTAPWVGITGTAPGGDQPVSLLLLDHPDNPHVPACADGEVSRRKFFAEQGLLFAWCGLNPVRAEPLTLEPRQSVTFRYRTVFSDIELTHDYGQYQYQTWATPWSLDAPPAAKLAVANAAQPAGASVG